MKNQLFSSGMFRSYDLWVMSPPRFHCATLLLFVFFDACPVKIIENNRKII